MELKPGTIADIRSALEKAGISRFYRPSLACLTTRFTRFREIALRSICRGRPNVQIAFGSAIGNHLTGELPPRLGLYRRLTRTAPEPRTSVFLSSFPLCLSKSPWLALFRTIAIINLVKFLKRASNHLGFRKGRSDAMRPDA